MSLPSLPNVASSDAQSYLRIPNRFSHNGDFAGRASLGNLSRGRTQIQGWTPSNNSSATYRKISRSYAVRVSAYTFLRYSGRRMFSRVLAIDHLSANVNAIRQKEKCPRELLYSIYRVNENGVLREESPCATRYCLLPFVRSSLEEKRDARSLYLRAFPLNAGER